jgi:acetyl esterase/lipase
VAAKGRAEFFAKRRIPLHLRRLSIAATLLVCFIAQAPLRAQQGAAKGPRLPATPPDLANVSYGPYERNLFDLWKAKSSKPTPLVIYIHGGAFLKGDKSSLNRVLLAACLKNGVSVAAITYRYSSQAIYPAPMADSARAVQFLRLHAGEYNLNPKAFAATGGSAGAGISLWIGFRDDMADPASDDPVKRQSTRLSSMAVSNCQTTYDPRTIATLINPETGRHDALRRLFGVKPGDDSLTASYAFKLYEEGSAINYLTSDDPPVLLTYTRSKAPPAPGDTGTGIHHPRFGYLLKEKMDKLGIECIVRTKEDYDGKPLGQADLDMADFMLKHFPKD